MERDIAIVLVGDSDISRWPPDLLPSIAIPIVSGHSGATLEQVLPHIRESIDRLHHQSASTSSNATSFIIVCAGENDVGNGIPLARTEAAFRSLLDLFRTKAPANWNSSSLHLIYLGPKFEPWLVDDREAQKSYVRMSQSFERICHDVDKTGQHLSHIACKIHYIDCLTMFCGASARQPGAILGGKAIAQSQYFDADQLHLSDEGYKIWQTVIEATIRKVLSNVHDF